MSKKENSFDRLRATNPVDESTVEGPESPRAKELLARIVSTPQPDEPPRRLGRRSFRLAVVLAVVAAITIAAAYVWTRVIEAPDAVACYQTVDLDADIAAAPSGGPATAEACIPVWRDGILVNPEIGEPGTVPPLTACVSNQGALAVFPSDDTTICSRFDLAYPDTESQSEADLLREVQDQLITYFQSADCIPIETATSEVRRILDQAQLTEWNIQGQPASDERPCASHSFDAPSRTVFLVPVPDE